MMIDIWKTLRKFTPQSCSLLALLVLTAGIGQKAYASDSAVFNGVDNYASIASWQPTGDFKVIAWLGDLDPNPSAKTFLLSSSSTNEYLAFTHGYVQGQWGSDHPGIWATGFDFNASKYVELTIESGKITASDGVITASNLHSSITPTSVTYDVLFKRGGGYSEGELQALILIDLNNTANSRAYAFDAATGQMEELNDSDTTAQVYNFTSGDWTTGTHTVLNPDNTIFNDQDWTAFYQGSGVSNVAKFNGVDSYASIAPWLPTGDFKVIAWLGDLNPDSSVRTRLLSSSSVPNEYLSFTHGYVQGQWGTDHPGIWGAGFDFNASKYVELTIESGKITASDGTVTASSLNSSINPTSVTYDTLFKRGGGFSEGELQALILIDLNSTANSRAYAFNGETGQIEELTGNDTTAQLHNFTSGDWTNGIHTVLNPDPTIFNDQDWVAFFDGTSSGGTQTALNLLGDDAKAVKFNGTDAYLELRDWTPQEEYRVVAWLSELDSDPSADTYLLSSHDGSYYSFTHNTVEAKLNGQTFNIAGPFDFESTGYVEIAVRDGEITASDGQVTDSVTNAAITETGITFSHAFRSGNNYSKGTLQALGLMDTLHDTQSNPYDPNDSGNRKLINIRGYQFNSNFQMIETGSDNDTGNYTHGIANTDYLDINETVVAPKPLLSTQSEWDNLFDQSYTTRPLLNSTSGNLGSSFAWHGHYWLKAYLTMAKTYNDDKYLDYATDLIDHMFEYTDFYRDFRGEIDVSSDTYLRAPAQFMIGVDSAAPGWRRSFGGGSEVSVLIDGQILNAITRVADYIKTENKQQYVAKADDYLMRAAEIIASHDNHFKEQSLSYLYSKKSTDVDYDTYSVTDPNQPWLWSGKLAFNHQMTMAVAMIYVYKHLSGNTSYERLVDNAGVVQVVSEPYDFNDMKSKIEDIVYLFDTNLVDETDGTCNWFYQLNNDGTGKFEDVNHGHIDVGFLLTARQENYIAQDDPMFTCMADTLVEDVFVAPGFGFFDINASSERGIAKYEDQIFHGIDWIDLQELNPKVLELNKHILRHYGDGNWSRSYNAWANVLYWQAQQSSQ